MHVYRISKEWRRRMVFMFLMLFGSAIWFFSDGYIVWPAEEKRHQVFKEMVERMVAAGEAKDEKDPAAVRAWERHAEQNDLATKAPKHRSDGDLAGQRIAGWVLFGGSVLFGAWVAWNHTRTVTWDGGQLVTGASGERVNIDTIVEMDRRKWVSKGIAYAIYEEGGKRRTLTLDDHKFLGCEAVIVEAEKRIAARAGETAPSDDTGAGETPAADAAPSA